MTEYLQDTIVTDGQCVQDRPSFRTDHIRNHAGMALQQFLVGGSEGAFVRAFAPAAQARCFCAALICIDRYARFQDVFSRQEQTRVVNAIMRTAIAFGAEKEIPACAAAQVDGRIAVVFCANEWNMQHFQRQVGQSLQDAAAWLSRRLPLTLSCGIGYPVGALCEVHSCLAHASQVMGYRLYRGKGCTILASPTRSAAPVQLHPPCKELADSIRQNDEKQAARLLAEFTVQIRQCGASDYSVRAAYLALLETLCSVPAHACLPDGYFAQLLSSFERLDTLEDIEALTRAEIHSACERACMCMRERILSADDLRRFVEEYYTNSALDIGVMVEKLGVSYSSARLLFKEYFGVSFLDCINLRRIARAKELLHMSGMNLKEIAVSVGYNNDQSFTRFFKKYEKITPGEYRKLVCQGTGAARRSA